ncbi:MAG: nitrate reductase cytochrome c-type subunit [Gammaproteobacteria bacterium]
MKRVIALLILAISASSATMAAAGNDSLLSLRGPHPITELDPAPLMKKTRISAPLKRAYVQQPPLIPHKIRSYQINRRSNKCLTCHSWSRYQETGATKISLTHFRDRAGRELANVSPRRYFCTQCHVPQVMGEPPVGNTFKPVAALGGE